MRRTIQAALVAITAVVALAAGAAPAAAQDCVTDYMRCSANIVTADSDELHDDYCEKEYVRCLTTLLRFY